ncbi:MAG: hypothetical protein LBG64_03265 [Pseudomonadales bacterium]|nr:hypothetical protein [Pseudomonadales bacterium]
MNQVEMLRVMVEFMPELKIFFLSLGIFMAGLVFTAIISPSGGGGYLIEDVRTGRTYRVY